MRINNINPIALSNNIKLNFTGRKSDKPEENSDNNEEDQGKLNAQDADQIQSQQNAYFIKASRKADALNQTMGQMSDNFFEMSKKAKETYYDTMLETEIASCDIDRTEEQIYKKINNVVDTFKKYKEAGRGNDGNNRIIICELTHDPNTKIMLEYLDDDNITYRETIINESEPSNPIPVKIIENQKDSQKHNIITLTGGVPVSYTAGQKSLTDDNYNADACIAFSTSNYPDYGTLSKPDSYAENISDKNGIFQADKFIEINNEDNTSTIYNGFCSAGDTVLSKSSIATVDGKPVEYIEYDEYGDEKAVMTLNSEAQMTSFSEYENLPDGTIKSRVIDFIDGDINYKEVLEIKGGGIISSKTLVLDDNNYETIKFLEEDGDNKSTVINRFI